MTEPSLSELDYEDVDPDEGDDPYGWFLDDGEELDWSDNE